MPRRLPDRYSTHGLSREGKAAAVRSTFASPAPASRCGLRGSPLETLGRGDPGYESPQIGRTSLLPRPTSPLTLGGGGSREGKKAVSRGSSLGGRGVPRFLATAAHGGEWQGLQPRGRDLGPTITAQAIGTTSRAKESCLDLLDRLGGELEDQGFEGGSLSVGAVLLIIRCAASLCGPGCAKGLSAVS